MCDWVCYVADEEGNFGVRGGRREVVARVWLGLKCPFGSGDMQGDSHGDGGVDAERRKMRLVMSKTEPTLVRLKIGEIPSRVCMMAIDMSSAESDRMARCEVAVDSGFSGLQMLATCHGIMYPNVLSDQRLVLAEYHMTL